MSRKLTKEEKIEYERLAKSAEQLSLEELLKETDNTPAKSDTKKEEK